MRSKIFVVITLVFALFAVPAVSYAGPTQKPLNTWADWDFGFQSGCTGLPMFGTISVHMVDRWDADGNYRGTLNVAGGRAMDALGRLYVVQLTSKGEQTFTSSTAGTAEYRYRYHLVPVGGGKGRAVETLDLTIQIEWYEQTTEVYVTTSSTCR